jgi:acyl carrier protein
MSMWVLFYIFVLFTLASCTTKNATLPLASPTIKPVFREDKPLILDRVKKVVVRKLDVHNDKVVESASFIEDLGADSLDFVEVVISLEEEFNITISDEDGEKLKTVGDAVAVISGKLTK